MRKVPPGHMKDQKLVMVIEGNTSDASSKTDSLSFGWGGGFLTQSHESRLNAVGSMMDQQTKSQSSSSVQTTMTTASLVLPNETGNEGKRFFMFRAQLTFGLSTKGVVNVPALFRHWIQTKLLPLSKVTKLRQIILGWWLSPRLQLQLQCHAQSSLCFETVYVSFT